MLKNLKAMFEKVPYPVGSKLALVPFSWRLGRKYSEFSRLIEDSASWSEETLENYLISHLREIVEYARNRFPFYRDLYRNYGVDQLEISTIGDFVRLPVVTKAMIREHFAEFSGAYKLNTGGTTGTPFAFYVDKDAWAREWAHMHRIWSFLGYDYRDINLAVRGKNLGERNIVYNPVHNEFLINTYRALGDFSGDFLALTRKHAHYYIHGYPSAVYNLILEMERTFPEEAIREIFSKVRGVLLHSEFPLDYMKRKFVEYNLPFISWYGHSEMCILAYDRNSDNCYTPFPTYGYAEVAEGRLLGTSFHNHDMPLIRYDTGDLAEVCAASKDGICTGFSITAGRDGDFITDRNGKEIPLTSLIFGRHHRAFELVDHLQVSQEKPGEATIYLITAKRLPEDLGSLLDLSHVDITFELVGREKPFLTPAGKLRLKL